MFIHCQFTCGEGPSDPSPTVIVCVLAPENPVQIQAITLIKDLINEKLSGGVSGGVSPKTIGFHTESKAWVDGVEVGEFTEQVIDAGMKYE